MTKRDRFQKQMKSISLLSLVLIGFIGFSFGIPGPDSGEGCKIYQSRKNENSNNLSLDQVDLSRFNFVEIYRYARLDKDTLFVLGRLKNDSTTLAKINLPDKKETKVAAYPAELTWSIRTATFTIFTLNKIKNSPLFVMVEYLSGNIGRKFDETQKNLDVFRSLNNHSFKLLSQEIIASNDIAYYINPKNEYLYLAVDDSTSGPGKKEPARKEEVEIQLNDKNHDGYTDILIRKKTYFSRKTNQTREDDFMLHKEEWLVLYFQKEKVTFSSPILLK